MKHHHFFPTLLTVFASLAVAHAQPEAPVRWAVDRASGPGTTAGFPEIDGVKHVELMRVTPETGTYSHHPHILHDGERFFAAWSNHRVDEDGPGQRVLFSTSADGRQWTEPAECFPPLGPAQPAVLRERGALGRARRYVGAHVHAGRRAAAFARRVRARTSTRPSTPPCSTTALTR